MLEEVKVEDGKLYWEENFIPHDVSLNYFDYFLKFLKWQQTNITIFGKTHKTPRKEAYFADKGMSYGYSGKQLTIQPWDKKVQELKNKIEEVSNQEFNACLVNLYEDGNHSNGWHADDEKELGKNPIIASLSLGTTRKFDLKHKHSGIKKRFYLNNGSLLIMGEGIQHNWKHQIPKETKVLTPRINLTFRKIVG